MTSRQLSQLADEYLEIARLEREALLKGQKTGLELSLRFENNEVDVRVALVTSGPALLAWDAARDNDSALVVGGNRLASRSGPLGTVMGLFLARTALAGNVIENASEAGTSLLVVPLFGSTAGGGPEGVAATGNVCYGKTVLPPRPLPAPLDTWDVFNAVTNT
jgi:hypothetical protein